MAKGIGITVENNLTKESRAINIYHHAAGSAHLINLGSTTTCPLGTASDGDYLHVSVVRGPGYLWNDCLINLPSWVDFEFSHDGKVSITHSGKRIIVKIPPGPPLWQLKITRPTASAAQTPGTVTVGDDGAKA